MKDQGIKHFYIPEEQSIYLLSHRDAKKLKDWIALCNAELQSLGFREIHLIGKGAYGFAFAGIDSQHRHRVFKFTRINLPVSIQDRLEEEAYMQASVNHTLVPKVIDYYQKGRQSILMMERAPGLDLEQVSLREGALHPRIVVKIAIQIGGILLALRQHTYQGQPKPIVHGDIKPSNLVWDANNEKVALIDWGSSVFAQLDEHLQPIQCNVLDLMSADLQQTNARLGDVYFIGDAQMSGAMSSPRFDEQGLASTLYALASGQSARFARHVIPPSALGLPRMLADILTYMLSDDEKQQREGGDYLLSHLSLLERLVFGNYVPPRVDALLPVWVSRHDQAMETVVYSSRKSFLQERNTDKAQSNRHDPLKNIDDAQWERYYKQYLEGMGETEKGFLAAISRLAKYPVVGGLAINWQPEGIYIDSSLNLHDPAKQIAFEQAVNNVVALARAIHRTGVFKCCLFDAKHTLHVERETPESAFIADANTHIPYEKSAQTFSTNESRLHSYFEDGQDPDELLTLPASIMDTIAKLNAIHHTGCIIFEVLSHHLKIHSYYRLLDHAQENAFNALLAQIVQAIPQIRGEGISGFMKLPYKDTRFFEHRARRADNFYPRNPKPKPG